MNSAEARAYLARHQAHDATALIKRWQKAARAAGWGIHALDHVNGWPVLALSTPVECADGLYLSAGVHGDEPAPPWGALEWFEEHGKALARRPIRLLPCLNPLGLAANTRLDHRGEDLNRQFHRADHPLVAAWKTWLGASRFLLSLCLHEDYDGQGVYCYELYHKRGPSLADTLLSRCESAMPRDGRKKIDTSRAVRGLIRRAKIPTHLPGFPEALALHQQYSETNLTFETPSEYSFYERVQAHRGFVTAAVRALGW